MFAKIIIDQDAKALDKVFEYIVPALDSSLEYDFEIIELDDGKLLCRTYNSLFVLDMTKADLHAY